MFQAEGTAWAKARWQEGALAGMTRVQGRRGERFRMKPRRWGPRAATPSRPDCVLFQSLVSSLVKQEELNQPCGAGSLE